MPIILFRCADCGRKAQSLTQTCEEGVMICEKCLGEDKWRLWRLRSSAHREPLTRERLRGLDA